MHVSVLFSCFSGICPVENSSSILIQTCVVVFSCGFCFGAGSSGFITLELTVGCDGGVGVVG